MLEKSTSRAPDKRGLKVFQHCLKFIKMEAKGLKVLNEVLDFSSVANFITAYEESQ